MSMNVLTNARSSLVRAAASINLMSCLTSAAERGSRPKRVSVLLAESAKRLGDRVFVSERFVASAAADCQQSVAR